MSSLPLRVSGSASKHHHRAGHHIGREPLGQRGARRGRVGGPGHIPHQALIAGAVLAGDHHRLLDPIQPGQGCLNFTELDAIPADLDLLISTPHIPQLPVSAPAHQIPGAIHPRPRPPERTRHKPRPGQPRPAHIPTPHPGTGHIQLTDHPRRHRPQPPIQHKQRRPRHRRADRHHPRPRCQRRTHRRIHRGLGRAVDVDHHPPGRPPIHHLGRAGLSADHQRRRSQTLGESTPTAEGVWVSTLTCSATSKAWKSSGERATDSGTTTSRPPCNKRTPDLPHREVESIRVTLRPHLSRRQLQAGIQ